MLYIYSSSSPHQWLTHVTSYWNAVIQCFQWFGTKLLPDTSLLLNVVIQCFQLFGVYYCTWWSCEAFLWLKETLFKRPSTWYWHCHGLANTSPNRSINTPEVREIHPPMLAFILAPLTVFSEHYFVNLPFVTQNRGHMSRTPLPSPLQCLLSL